MSTEVEAHIDAVDRQLRKLINGGNNRLIGGRTLWAQYEQAVEAFRQHSRAQVMGIVERVNELVVCKLLLDDPTLASRAIEYEPEIVPQGQRFDFVGTGKDDALVYVEVKTVYPHTDDSEENWRKVERRRSHLTPGTHYVVDKEWMGATIFNNSLASRDAFMRYTRETETKLAAHNAIRPGRGILVFCGSGFQWHLSELEDFADFYQGGRHRMDDPFAAMECHAMESGGTELTRTLKGFAALIRKHDAINPEQWAYPVRGPSWGR